MDLHSIPTLYVLSAKYDKEHRRNT